MKPRDIHEAVDQLIQRQRIRLHREHTGRTEWQTLPSLWEQLETSTGYSTSSGGNGGYNSQPTVSTAVVSLIIEIAGACGEAARELAGKSRGNVPDNLRAIAGALISQPDGTDALDWWTEKIITWTAEARAALRLDPDRPRWARGIRCPDCGADTARTTIDGEAARTPALAVLWVGPDDDQYHADDAWKVRAVECRSCGVTWFRGVELDGLVTQMLAYNATRETMTDGAA